MNEIKYLIRQLDLIIGFLEVSDQTVYEAIKSHDRLQLGLTIDSLYNNSYQDFRNHITTSSLILGFTHFEDFLTKMTSKMLVQYPTSNKIKFDISRLEELGSDYQQALADEQAKKLTFAEKTRLIRHVFTDFDADLIEEILRVNQIRNCLMHNNGLADDRLASKYPKGSKIFLSSNEIHGYGLKARKFAEELWKRLDK